MDSKVYQGISEDLTWRAHLERARTLLEGGQVGLARNAALGVLRTAQADGDRSVQGHALLALAQYDRVVGRFRRAIEAAQQAAQLFQLEGDIGNEASALSLLAHSRSILARDEEAVEAAMLSVHLGELLPPGPQQVALTNYLGVTYLWSKSFTKAEAALRESERLALQGQPPETVLLPRSNLAWLEVMRLFHERYLSGNAPDTAALSQRLVQCQALFERAEPFVNLPGVRSVLQRLVRSAKALELCWSSQPEAARTLWQAERARPKSDKFAEVANVVSDWVLAEIEWSSNDLGAAQRAAELLIQHASNAEFEQMACLGHLLLTQIHQQQGRTDLALQEERAHRRRELRIRADILESRDRVVRAHLDIRASQQDLQLLAGHARELERLSYEDALTGISNRRHFEQRLAAAIVQAREAERPLCLAVIDLNRFKRINDEHSHQTGDMVLRAVAQTIQANLREADLAARIGGDEFVALLPDTPLELAHKVCERVKEAIAALRWDFAPSELQVSASLGLTMALPGEDGAALLRRSDLAMFESKNRQRAR